jgi:hypothetical protein
MAITGKPVQNPAYRPSGSGFSNNHIHALPAFPNPTPPKITGTRFAGSIRGVDFGPKQPKFNPKSEQKQNNIGNLPVFQVVTRRP